jgi:hypothetical protein
VTVFDPSDSVTTINNALNAAAGSGTNGGRREFYFMPGTYGDASQAPPQIAGVAAGSSPTSAQMLAAANAASIISAPMGNNMIVAGLGESPCDVRINGALFIENGGLSVTQRRLENLTLDPIEANTPAHTMHWVSSQTAVWRRVNFLGNVEIANLEAASQPAYGAMFANSTIGGKILTSNGRNVSFTSIEPYGFGNQSNLVYYVQDSTIGGFQGYGELYDFIGTEGAPADDFGSRGVGIAEGDSNVTPDLSVVRESPFVYWDSSSSSFKVFSPSVQHNRRGSDWTLNSRTGTSLPLSSFYVAKPATDTAATLQAQLDAGKNLLLNPGSYNLSATLTVAEPDHVVFGLGNASISGPAGARTITIADAATNTVMAGLSLGGTTPTSTTPDSQLQIGVNGGTGDARNPTTLSDVDVGSQATTDVVINQNDVLMNQGEINGGGNSSSAAAWATPVGSYGIVVNGDHVTLQGLYVEHFKKTLVVWNGNDGQAQHIMNEPPYTPYYATPNVVPDTWSMNYPSFVGWPTLYISKNVTNFDADSYVSTQIFMNGCDCQTTAEIVTPAKPGIEFHGVYGGVVTYPAQAGTTLVQYDPNEINGEHGQVPKFYQPTLGVTAQFATFSGIGGFISQSGYYTVGGAQHMFGILNPNGTITGVGPGAMVPDVAPGPGSYGPGGTSRLPFADVMGDAVTTRIAEFVAGKEPRCLAPWVRGRGCQAAWR